MHRWSRVLTALGLISLVACNAASLPTGRGQPTPPGGSDAATRARDNAAATVEAGYDAATTGAAREAAEPLNVAGAASDGPHPAPVRTVQAQVKVGQPPQVRITAMTFIDPNRGWLADGERILASADGGRTWAEQYAAARPVTHLDFSSAERGWAVMDGKLLATTDGGKSWGQVAVPGSEPLVRVDFTTAADGWASAGDGLFTTRDGGETWQAAENPCSSWKATHVLSATTPTTAWLMCAGGPATQHQQKQLYRTRDGGQSWALVADTGLPGKSPPRGRLPISGHARDLFFLDEQRGWMGQSRGVLYATTDGGRTWQPVPGMDEPELFIPTVRFVSPEHGFVLLSAGGEQVLFATRDGGVSFARLLPPPNPWPVQMIDARNWVAAGTLLDAGAILRTVDAGRTWQQVGSIAGESAGPLSFVDPAHGWAVGRHFDREAGSTAYTLYRTTDGGATWAPVHEAPRDPKGYYRYVAFVDRETGFVASGWGHLSVTNDGGKTFTVVDDTDASGHDFDFVSPQVGWKTRDFRLYGTGDGGRSWRPVPLDARIVQFDLLPDGSAWVIGDVAEGRGLFYSDDGGHTWTHYDLGQLRPDAIRCADAAHCLLRAQDGALYATAHGGRIWAPAAAVWGTGTGAAETTPGASMTMPGTGAKAGPDGCASAASPRRRGPLQPAGPESPVRAHAFVREDPGIAEPIQAAVSGLPVTIAVQFDGPVDRESFGLAVVDFRCDYTPGPVEQEVRWLSDREAEVTVRALPYGKPGPYGLTLGRGRDREGREVREPNLSFSIETGLGVRVYALPLAGGEPRLLWETEADLEPRGVSPDGRYLLLGRRLNAMSSSHSPVRIPYLVNLEASIIRAYSRGPMERLPRWDLPNRAVWVSGWQRLTLDGDGDTGQTLLEHLPTGTGYLLAAAVSPDGRWLAALRTPGQNIWNGAADLIMVDLSTGQTRTEPEAAGYLEAPNGPPGVGLEWSPNGLALLLTDYDDPNDGGLRLTLINPETLARTEVPVAAAPPRSLAQWVPGGRTIAISGYGVIGTDGTPVLKDPDIRVPWTPAWSPDGRLLLKYRETGEYVVVEVTTGKEAPLPLPPEVSGFSPLGFSADGTVLYLGGRR